LAIAVVTGDVCIVKAIADFNYADSVAAAFDKKLML
jgi:hypothetical protein